MLLLAGFNLPISEDLISFSCAVLATQNPEYYWPLFLGVFGGAYISDVICYAFMGRYLGTKLFKIKFFSRMVPHKRIDRIAHLYTKYGAGILIVGRMIPFGVRNALFMTAGISGMSPTRFVIIDGIAALISCSIFFNIYYRYGEAAISYVRKGSATLLITVVVIVLLGVAWKKMVALKN